MDKDLRTEKMDHLQTRIALYQSQQQTLSMLLDRTKAELDSLKREEAAEAVPG